MEVRRSTVGVYEDSLACQLLGQTYYVHPDKTIKITVDLVVTSEVIGAFPRTAPGRAEVQIKELGFHFIDPLAPIAEKEIVPRVRVFIPYLNIEGWISITSRGPALDNGHLIVELKYLQAMHVKNRMLKKCCYTLYLLELADRLRGEASRETLKTARKNVVELDMALLARPTLAGVIRKFANAIARKAAEARGETFVPTPYDETAVDAVVVTAVPPVAPVVAPEPAPPAVAAPAGPPLKALEAMTAKECNAELDAAGVPKKGRSVANTTIGILRDLVRRLRAGEPAASLTVPRKPKSAEELFVIDKAEQLACSEDRRPSTSIFRATLFSSQATLVADGAKKVVFSTGAKNANGTDYLKARFRGLGETDPLRLEFEARGARRMCYRVIRDAKRRAGAGKPRAEDDECPAYYGVDYKEESGKSVCKFTVHEGTKTLRAASAPADRRRSRVEILLRRTGPAPAAREAFATTPERFYGIDDRGRYQGKVAALAVVPGSGSGSSGLIVFGLYDSRPPRPRPPSRTTTATRAASSSRWRAPGQPRRVAKLYVVPNGEVVSPPPPPIYHVTENGERLLVLYATRVQRPLIPAIQQVHKQRAEFLALFDESEVEMAAAMFDSRPIEIARPLLFESEEDAERRERRAAQAQVAQKKRKAPAEAPAPAAAPAKKKKKKRSRRRAPPAEISEYERTRMRNIAAGNKKLYSLGLIHPPPDVAQS
ncbi:hypothetical protein JL720_16403 [Aureococcus anophagefferens]|nr:hypothetical protein JL720_16403 [Aureococcus anophagefferens]